MKFKSVTELSFMSILGTVSRNAEFVLILVLLVGTVRADVDPQKLNELVTAGKYEDLEQIANACRMNSSVHYYGADLEQFYEIISSPGGDDSDAVWDTRKGELEKWSESRPTSVTPKVALANFYVAWGWKARGSGWASTVSQQGWKDLGDRIAQANKLLTEAEGCATKDPHVYFSELKVALGAGWSKADMEKAFEKGRSVDRYYYPLYEAKTHYLLPRWYGDRDDNLKFAEEASAAMRNPDDGDALYSIIAGYVALTEGGNFFQVTSFSWARMKKGIVAIENNANTEGAKRVELNKLAYLSYLAKDYPTSASAFDILKQKQWYSMGFWGGTQEDLDRFSANVHALVSTNSSADAKPKS
jgi:hypothetical protein